MKLIKINSIPVNISKTSILRHIGRNKNKMVSKRILNNIKKAKREIFKLAKARAIYRVMPIKNQNGFISLEGALPFKSKILALSLSSCDKAAVFLLTLGYEVDRMILKQMNKRPNYGLILDAAASAATESTAKYLRNLINYELNIREVTTRHYSPGYCDWPVSEQDKIFKLLPSEIIDVDLSKIALMSPRKSLSGVIGISAKNQIRNACTKCIKTQCFHRTN